MYVFFLLRETIVSWYRTGAKFGMWLLFSLLFLVSGKKRKKTFLLLAPLLHFLLKVSEKRKKCDGIEVPEKKGTFSSCGMYARMLQKEFSLFKSPFKRRPVFSGAFTLDSHLTQNMFLFSSHPRFL